MPGGGGGGGGGGAGADVVKCGTLNLLTCTRLPIMVMCCTPSCFSVYNNKNCVVAMLASYQVTTVMIIKSVLVIPSFHVAHHTLNTV